MEKEWLYIDNIDTLPATDYVHCDTRESEKIKKLKKFIRNRLRQDEFKFRRDEILGTLKALEMGSGGPSDWRMLRLKPSSHYDIDWLKYIRFVAVEEVEMFGHMERVYIAYSDCGGQFTQLSRTDLSQENLDTEYLNHITWGPNQDPRKQKIATSEVVHCETPDDLINCL